MKLLITVLRTKGRNRRNNLYFVLLPLSYRQLFGISAWTVHIHRWMHGMLSEVSEMDSSSVVLYRGLC